MGINNALYERSAVTVGATEYSVANNSTTVAAITTDAVISIWVDCANMAAGDEFEIAIYEKAMSTSTARRCVLASLVGAQTDLFITGPYQVGNGWDVTLKKIAGTDRAFDIAVRAIT